MKFLCVLLPHFPLRCEVLRNNAVESCPTLVLQPKDAVSSQKLVLDYSPELENIQRGMSVQQALSLHGDVRLVYADIPHYRSIFNKVLDALELKSPLVEGANLGCAYLGLDGLHSIYPDDSILIKNVKEAIPATFAVRMGIAEGKFPAYLAALYSPPQGYRILTGKMEAFLKELDCDVLPVSLKSKNKLRDLGIRTLGQIASLPRGAVQSQFGPEGRMIWELAGGYDDTPLYPRCSEEMIEESTTLSSMTVSLEAILVMIESLLSRAFARDSLKGRGISRITLWTRRWGSGHWEQDIRFKEPAMDIKSALSRIKPVLENCPQPGPVEQIGIRLSGLSCRRGRQRSLFSEVRAKDHLLEDIKQLELRLGSPQVFKIKEVEPWSRIPERRYALTPLSQ
jgi:DNA polymerase-4